MKALLNIRDWAICLLVLCAIAYFLCASYAVFSMLGGGDPSPVPAAIALACGFPCAFVAFSTWMAAEILGIRHPETRDDMLSSDQRVIKEARKRMNRPLP